MAGETVLVIEDSSAERDIAQRALEDAGYRVISAANAVAALTYPEVEDINLVVLDSMLDGVSGLETARMLRSEGKTHSIPILMLIPEESVKARENIISGGADGFLLKPYDGKTLALKASGLIEQRFLDDLSSKYLNDMADEMMKELARAHVKDAVERKTQIIIERLIQNVATAVDERAREEVDKHVAALTAEKEQELVKITVREVANSMVEKLAERKVREAMDNSFVNESERVVQRIVDQTLPGAIRERLKESCNNMLPREIQVRLQKAAEKMVPELSEQLVGTVEAIAAKAVPRISREILPSLSEKQTKVAFAEQVPRQVADLVNRELDAQIRQKLEPTLNQASVKLRRTVLIWNSILGGIVTVGLGLALYLTLTSG